MRYKHGEETVGNEGAAPSETAKRYRENDMGTGGGDSSDWPGMPKDQSLGSIERGLPDESLGSLVGSSEAGLKKTGKDSIL